MTFESKLDFGDRVVIDGDDSMIVKVCGFKYLWAGCPLVEIVYFHAGDQKCVLIEEQRLTRV